MDSTDRDLVRQMKNDRHLAFEKAAEPLIKYLCENHHPMVAVIATPTGAEMLESKMTIFIDKYLKD